MGAAMAGHLLAAGTPLTVYDPVAEARRPVVERGAAEGEGAADVASVSDVVLVVVVDDEQSRAAVTEAAGAAAPGTVVAICASVRPDTCRELAAAGADRGVDVIDAALVRGERGAEEGQLVLYCGGPEEAIERVREACAPFLEAAIRVGDIGAGQVAKTANNI